jgi:hypothetical protein
MRRTAAITLLVFVAGVLLIGVLLVAEVSLVGAVADEMEGRTCNLGDEVCMHRADNLSWQLAGMGAIALAIGLFWLLTALLLTRLGRRGHADESR